MAVPPPSVERSLVPVPPAPEPPLLDFLEKRLKMPPLPGRSGGR